jgi:hypothetical protein
VTAQTGQFSYWPSGAIDLYGDGASATLLVGGGNPTFTSVRVYYIKEPSAGTLTLSVAGSAVATADAADASVGLGMLEYTQSVAAASVSLACAGGSVRVLFVHVERSDRAGVDAYLSMSSAGLALSSSTASAQGMAIWTAALTQIAPDLIMFEMDDSFGDGGTAAAAWVAFKSVLDAGCPLADKIIIGSTPRASLDGDKLAASNYLRGAVAAADASYLYFDTYRLMGSYADQVAIFGSDDGTHPNKAAQAFAASVLWDFLGLSSPLLGRVPRAVVDRTYPSWIASGSMIGPPDVNGVVHKLTVDTYGNKGVYQTEYAFGVSKADGTCKFQISHSGAYPTVMPLAHDFDSAGNVRKQDTVTLAGTVEFTRLRKTDNVGGKMHLDVGMVRLASYTRAELIAQAGANTLVGTICWCSDATGGAGLVVARGTGTTDWIKVDGATAI